MKTFLSYLFLLLPFCSVAQTKRLQETTLLQQLNSVLQKTPYHHGSFEEYKMRIDTPLAINSNGELSMTLRYFTDTSFFRVRMAAPLAGVNRVMWDMYLILRYANNAVTFYESEHNQEELKEASRTNLFHIGLLDTDDANSELTMDSIKRNLASLNNNKHLLPASDYYRDQTFAAEDFIDGRIAVQRDDKYGYIDTAHLVVIPFIYDQANDFAEGLAAVKKGDKWGYIDPTGAVVIPFQFKDASDFSEGTAYVYRNKKRFYINKKGAKVPEPKTDN